MKGTADRSRETKERILDAAENLFARRGFHHTSLRALTTEAGVNLAAVNYHFGSKVELLKAVFNRRLDPLNAVRIDKLSRIRSRAERAAARPGIEETLRAFFEPVITFSGSGGGARSFVTLVGRVMSEPDRSTREIFITSIRPVLMLCYELLCRALPHLSRETIFWRLLFSIGAMSRVMCLDESSPILPEEVAPPDSPASMLPALIAYVSAGMEAP